MSSENPHTPRFGNELFERFIDKYRPQILAVLAAGITSMQASEIAGVCGRDYREVEQALPGLVLAGIFSEVQDGGKTKYALTAAAQQALAG